jgi:transcriptional regulator of nitric oxide reductase
MLFFDLLTAGSASAAFAFAASGAAGVAAAGFIGVVLGVTVACADATNPAVASSAKIRVFFSMNVLQKSMAIRPRLFNAVRGSWLTYVLRLHALKVTGV